MFPEIDRAWRAYGVGPDDRRTLAEDLRLDLEAAAADGVSPEALIGPDVGAFARRLADEAGVVRTRPAYGSVLLFALAGAGVAAALGTLLLTALSPLMGRLEGIGTPVQVAVVAYYGPAAVLVVAGAVLAVRLLLSHLPRIRETALRMAVLLPVAGIVITPVTMGFAWATGYNVATIVVGAEIVLVLSALGGATALSRWLSIREPGTAGVRPTPHPA